MKKTWTPEYDLRVIEQELLDSVQVKLEKKKELDAMLDHFVEQMSLSKEERTPFESRMTEDNDDDIVEYVKTALEKSEPTELDHLITARKAIDMRIKELMESH